MAFGLASDDAAAERGEFFEELMSLVVFLSTVRVRRVLPSFSMNTALSVFCACFLLPLLRSFTSIHTHTMRLRVESRKNSCSELSDMCSKYVFNLSTVYILTGTHRALVFLRALDI